MLFNSFQFAFFFLVVTAVYFLLPLRGRIFFLLGASYYFYACWEPAYLILIVASTVTDYLVGLALEKTENERRRKLLLLCSLTLNIGILAVFKYANFFARNLTALATHLEWDWSAPTLSFLLPVGISFYTFQTMAYTIDVYRKKQETVRDFPVFCLYVTFFPQLVAGPIERAQNLLPQFEQKHPFRHNRVTDGLSLMLWGLFKKVAVADRLALLVDEVYRQPDICSGPDLILGTVAFAFQIYCDFSGYSDMAIGASLVLGIGLMDNFNKPYNALSIRDFWARWHISLTTWFRDYLYYPLGGNRVSTTLWGRNILIVFLVSGFWHGANWTFLAWGLLHSLYYFVERWWGGRLKLPDFASWFLTFSSVCLAWIFFRAESVQQALSIVGGLSRGWSLGAPVVFDLPLKFLLLTLYTLVLMLALEKLQGEGPPRGRFPGSTPFRWGIYYLLIFSTILFGSYDSAAFIYFQF